MYNELSQRARSGHAGICEYQEESLMLDEMLDVFGGTPGRILGLGLALGLGVILGRGARPVAKGAVKGMMVLTDRVKEATAEANESLQDLMAEARSEREQEMGPAPQQTT
jgi:hypothetical protein